METLHPVIRRLVAHQIVFLLLFARIQKNRIVLLECTRLVPTTARVYFCSEVIVTRFPPQIPRVTEEI